MCCALSCDYIYICLDFRDVHDRFALQHHVHPALPGSSSGSSSKVSSAASATGTGADTGASAGANACAGAGLATVDWTDPDILFFRNGKLSSQLTNFYDDSSCCVV